MTPDSFRWPRKSVIVRTLDARGLSVTGLQACRAPYTHIGSLLPRSAAAHPASMLVESTAVALTLFLALLGIVVVKYIRYRWYTRSATSDDDSSSDDDEGVTSGDGEKIALIAQEAQLNGSDREGATAVRHATAMGRKLWMSLRDLLVSPFALVGTKLQPLMREKRRSAKSSKRKVRLPPKKIHKPYFYPLLEETAQWWETQCQQQLQAIKVEDATVVAPPPTAIVAPKLSPLEIITVATDELHSTAT
ncbi:hypothetical protein FI667_g7905, partial [Globisporangium splendens]